MYSAVYRFFSHSTNLLSGGHSFALRNNPLSTYVRESGIRYVLSGSAFFDVREAPTDTWIRLAIETGDLVVLPAGMYHRFTLDEANNIISMRLFQDEPKWTPHKRSQDTDINPHRIQYLDTIGVGA